MAVNINFAGNARNGTSLPNATRLSGPGAWASVVADTTLLGSGVSLRELAQAQSRDSAGQVRERLLNQVNELVQGMEILAKRITTKGISSTQRTVLMSRFNDLERQVNEIDGIVGSEGRETQGRQALIRGRAAATATTPAQTARAARQRLSRLQHATVVDRQAAQRVVDTHLRGVPAPRTDEVHAAARQVVTAVRTDGSRAAHIATAGTLVDMNA